MSIRIGISGWRYPRWRGRFYPGDLVQREELAYASRCFPSIELNGSFYSLQRPESWKAWREATPPRFVFAVKGPRFITHTKRLRDCDTALANFFASGLLQLGPKLGPILWQLPPTLRFDAEQLDTFLSALPRDEVAAAALARRRDRSLMSGRSTMTATGQRRIRHALEVRHDSFLDAGFIALLRRHGVGLVVADAARRYPLMEDVTADFVYIRLHGDAELYASGYSDAALDRWAQRISCWAAGGEADDAARSGPPAKPRKRRDVYCYFDNDAKVHAPFDAASLMRRLGQTPGCEMGQAP
ncbi:MAG TPA: DUF72 domain-containing protein [Stenotrophomonas sp.]|nr:DUF72 domain-containing protein [Stenotrophomonas sp.]